MLPNQTMCRANDDVWSEFFLIITINNDGSWWPIILPTFHSTFLLFLLNYLTETTHSLSSLYHLPHFSSANLFFSSQESQHLFRFKIFNYILSLCRLFVGCFIYSLFCGSLNISWNNFFVLIFHLYFNFYMHGRLFRAYFV